jgi:predicted amidohydrolase
MAKKGLGLTSLRATAQPVGNLICGAVGSSRRELPEHGEVRAARAPLTPRFALAERDGRTVLLAAGNGSDDCAGWLVIPVAVRRGRTYRLAAQFSFSPGLNPHQHLLFAFYTQDFNDGIFSYRRLGDRRAAGESCFAVPGRGLVEGEVRIGFRLSAKGKAWIEAISMEECEPVPARPVTVVAMQGKGNGLRAWERVLRVAGRAGADLVLIPEVMNGPVKESLRGPSARLMSGLAGEFGMYVAGGILHADRLADRVYNTALLYDRKGRLTGRYRKNHPYSPELNDQGVTPGTEVPVFSTDFGKVGIIICYDGWFGDVTELLALRGAEIVLFPSAGYYRGLMPARAADNCVHIVASSLDPRCTCGIWDSAGRDVTCPDLDASLCLDHRGFSHVRTRMVGEVQMVMATLDLAQRYSPHWWGGPMLAAPGGRRNRRDQKRLLYGDIQREAERWWEE